MSENWNLETVSDSKPEAPAEKSPEAAAPATIPPVLSSDHSLGEIMTTAREARGFSRAQAAKASNIPGYYLTMIETDDYSSIADQLYLLPFLRRYATFVGLEPEEVASRFIRDVQRADMNPVRVSEPIPMLAERRRFPWRAVLMTGGAIAIVAIAWFGYHFFVARKSATANSKSPTAAEQAAPDIERAVPKAADTEDAKVVPVPMPAASGAVAAVAAPSAAAAPAAVASASAAPPSPAASASKATSGTNSAARSAAPPASSAPSRSPAARQRAGAKVGSNSHRLSVQNRVGDFLGH